MCPLRAALFDMDGTLVDTEEQTDQAIADELAERGVAGVKLPPDETRGRTWDDVAASLRRRHPIGAAPDLAAALLSRWSILTAGAAALPGAVEQLTLASRHLKVAVVSSSPRSAVDTILARLGVQHLVPPSLRIGGDEVRAPKPDPTCFVLAAERMGVAPGQCVVFEDSSAGLRAATAGGMWRVAVLLASAEPQLCRTLADVSIHSFLDLPAGFWPALATDAAVLKSLLPA